jgi:hypothetical protein
MDIIGRVYTLAVYRYSRAVGEGRWSWRVWRGLAWLALKVGMYGYSCRHHD